MCRVWRLRNIFFCYLFLVVDIYKIDLRNDRLAFKEAGEVVNVRYGTLNGSVRDSLHKGTSLLGLL